MLDTDQPEEKGHSVPLVSIGLPVFNGDNYLRQSIQSILDQTFQDFELIISDNCSTDSTEEICKEFAEKSDKIIYFRQDKNVGAAANFEFTFRKSRGKYFKWQGHDDYAYPEFLEKCLARLVADPDAVLCQSHVALVDANGHQLGIYAHEDFGTTSPDPIARFAGRLRNVSCNEIHGLMRRSVLEKTERLGPFVSHDRCLLSHLALMGRFLSVPEVLFAWRLHAEQFSTSVMGKGNLMQWVDPERADWPSMRRWTHIVRCIHYLNTVDLGTGKRLRGYKALVAAQLNPKHLHGLVRETGRFAKYACYRLLKKLTHSEAPSR
jgi:glycosyltransferase involved in cell wall biosynthesis